MGNHCCSHNDWQMLGWKCKQWWMLCYSQQIGVRLRRQGDPSPLRRGKKSTRRPVVAFFTKSKYVAPLKNITLLLLTLLSQHLHKIKVSIRPRSMAHSSPKFFGFSARVAVAILMEYSSIKKGVWVKFV